MISKKKKKMYKMYFIIPAPFMVIFRDFYIFIFHFPDANTLTSSDTTVFHQ